MTFYCLGFLFSTDLSRVLLIRKAKPSWQAGKLNGIGGKVETGETSLTAMVRECREETGLKTCRAEWKRFCTMTVPDFMIDCFAGVCGTFESACGTEAEPLELCSVSWMHTGCYQMIDSLQWLIPLALDHLRDGQPASAAVSYGEWSVREVVGGSLNGLSWDEVCKLAIERRNKKAG